MTKSKNLIEPTEGSSKPDWLSRTVRVVIIGLAATFAQLTGIDADTTGILGLTESGITITEILQIVSFFLAWYYRREATGPLRLN